MSAKAMPIDNRGLIRVIRRSFESEILGCQPVCLAMRASILGPISTRSWNAKT